MDANTQAVTPTRLAETTLHSLHTVAWVEAPLDAPEFAQLLAEIGFLPGESVSVMAHGMFGGDPLVVRVGNSTFALRRAEAACVLVTPRLVTSRLVTSQLVTSQLVTSPLIPPPPVTPQLRSPLPVTREASAQLIGSHA